MKPENRKAFIFYLDWKEILENLTDEQVGKLTKAMINHTLGIPIKLDSTLAVVFIGFRQALDRSTDRWNRIVERNRINGAKGGRPKKTQNNPNNPMGSLGFVGFQNDQINPKIKNPDEAKKTQNNPNNPKNKNKKDINIQKTPQDLEDYLWSEAYKASERRST